MSGSGSGGGGSGPDRDDWSCATLRFEALIASPQPAVVANLAVGEVLLIATATMNGQTVVQVLKGPQLVGGLAGPEANRLRNCIEQGHEYEATVRSINAGQVRVLVEHT